MGKFYLNLSIHPSSKPLLFTDASWESMDAPRGIGFVLIISEKRIFLVGCCHTWTELSVHAEALALKCALSMVEEKQLEIEHIFSDCIELLELIQGRNLIHNWCIGEDFQGIHRSLSNFNNAKMEVIPRDWNPVADRMVGQGLRYPQLSLCAIKGRTFLTVI